LSRGAAYTRVLGVPTAKNPEDSNLVSVEAMQCGSSSTYPLVMMGVMENI
jgi:hypothetical protein